MAEKQPQNVVEGATIDEEEVPVAAKSAEERKAAAALSSLEVLDDESAEKDVDQEAVRKAMDRLAVSGKANGTTSKVGEKVVKKAVKVDAGDVALLIEELELSKIKATDLLKAHDGDAAEAMRAFITPSITV